MGKQSLKSYSPQRLATMNAAEHCQYLRRGQYLGEISALCFLHLPSHLCNLPLLLAGTGSQILVYDLLSEKIIRSFEVFEGIRVHGIALDNFNEQLQGFLGFRLASFGERTVKLFNLQILPGNGENPILDIKLSLICSLPKFGHWVLDVSFLKRDGATSTENACFLAIGCSDNSVSFWNILTHNMFSKVTCAERCLLYSMKMLGSEIKSLIIASGTIFNEIVVWKVVLQNQSTIFTGHEEYCNFLANEGDDNTLAHPKYRDAFMCRLVGHEGSIFRIAWFSNGTKLVSVSDDRSARIWEVTTEREVSYKAMQGGISYFAGPVLFGHSARIWDCCIFDSVIITAGEDCTCRVWDHDGKELTKMKEHTGRGVWRCLYDPRSSLLVTAGFDSAIKVHQLFTSSKGSEQTIASQDLSGRKEVFSLILPNFSMEGGLMDSKSEYVRCLHFAREDSLYVATNNGYLYHATLYNVGPVKWTELGRISEEAPIICVDIMSKGPDSAGRCEDWIAVGDGKGIMTIIQVLGAGSDRKVEVTFTWPVEKERHLLGSYWCKSLENRFIFTADPGGRLKMWKLCCTMSSDSKIPQGNSGLFFMAEYTSCFGMRIMCVDASLDQELIVCGDIRGNLLLFSLPRSLACGSFLSTEVKKTPTLNYLKGVHGVSTVNSVFISSVSPDQVEIRSTGADGCICYLKHDRELHDLEFIRMKQVKELSAIRSVYTTGVHSDDSAVGNYAVGFSSTNFIIWNLISGTKVLQITCGGWRRPHSYYLGVLPEMNSCFSFVKDNVIYIHRHWVPGTGRKIYPQNLHLQSHGREIHSLCFINKFFVCNSYKDQDLVPESSWIATGSEDGSVRLIRYEPVMDNWSSSQYLGEHVGGSAVRSICSVSRMHIFMLDSANIPNAPYRQNGAAEDENPSILISVGAKRVITAWKQLSSQISDALSGSSASKSPFSFQWLSTDVPGKRTSSVKKNDTEEFIETVNDPSTSTSDAISINSCLSGYRNLESNICLEDSLDHDWRYLDITAFHVKEAGSRVSTCFILVACSDATVTLKALVLPFRLWFDVALLCSLSSSPVLSLQHVVIPKPLSTKGKLQVGSLYMAFAGSTDGSIAIWDLTECVEDFMLQISKLEMENCMKVQTRPKTGRGSQGGQRWRSITNARNKPVFFNLREKDNNGLVSIGRKPDFGMENHAVETSEISISSKSHVFLQEAPQTASASESKTAVRLWWDVIPCCEWG
ncbi:uncharacterized protein LOC127242882 isoform X2 [Andrographis paniculata]|uniref:uncharacterized protein LOC127242882 isoform X2 n=1 Tax=Andrographis paniculata TaxID=175694 RepID=UPI0021E89EB4|nr:uncharacterized protein LOC127242882 isoform X2 [Andrographis paniculata]